VTQSYINRIATAVPDDDVHDAFVAFADQMLEDPRVQRGLESGGASLC
jgi:hypothetical protein